MNNDKIYIKFYKDVKSLQKKIKYYKLYNFRNAFIRKLIKSGIMIDYALPFVLVGIITATAQSSINRSPFKLDMVKVKERIETIDTSTGIHLKHTSFDYKYSDKTLEYSTGWTMSDDGLYERTITTYKLNSGVDLSDTNKILSMSKEEIEKLLSIKNIKKIRKSILDPDDDLYLNDALILTNNFISDENVALKQETVGQNFVSIIIYMIAVLTWGYNLKNFKEKLLKNKVKNRIAIIEQQYQEITDIDLYSMKVVLELQKENLAMLDLDEKNIDQDSNNQYKLRKV